jgi:hypothetical protein
MPLRKMLARRLLASEMLARRMLARIMLTRRMLARRVRVRVDGPRTAPRSPSDRIDHGELLIDGDGGDVEEIAVQEVQAMLATRMPARTPPDWRL